MRRWDPRQLARHPRVAVERETAPASNTLCQPPCDLQRRSCEAATAFADARNRAAWPDCLSRATPSQPRSHSTRHHSIATGLPQASRLVSARHSARGRPWWQSALRAPSTSAGSGLTSSGFLPLSGPSEHDDVRAPPRRRLREPRHRHSLSEYFVAD